MLKNNKKRFFLVISSVCVFTAILSTRYQLPLELFPENETLFEYSAFSDGDYEDGYSSATVDTAHGHMHFEYKLNSKSEYPSAMLIFHVHELDYAVNLQKYRYINVKVDTAQTDKFLLSLHMYIPGFSDPANSQTHRMYSYICKNGNSYRYPISDFVTPNWWFSANKTTDENLPKTNWGKMTHLTIANCYDTPFDTTIRVTLESFSIEDSFFMELLIALFVVIIYIIGFFLVSHIYRRSKNLKIKRRIYYRESSDNFYSENDAEAVTNYLSENYSNALLTFVKVEKATNVKIYIINQILKDRFNMSYKQYVTHIRILEAKRILLETELPVFAVAEQVGYCYSNSFIRTFRTIEDITPAQYRKKNQMK